MNVNQYMDKIVQDVAARNGNINEVYKASRDTYNKHIAPKMEGKSDAEKNRAQHEWTRQNTVRMQKVGLLAQDGQSQASFKKDQRAERAVQESARTGSKTPIIKETTRSVLDTLGNAFSQGAGSMIESTARFANDIGENEKGTYLDRLANYGGRVRKGYEDSASTMQKGMQSGEYGTAAKLGIGGVQSIPAMTMPMGAAAGTTRVVGTMAAKAAPYVGLAVGTAAGHTQNYGEVRRGATQALERDFPTPESLNGNAQYQQNLNMLLDNGVSTSKARAEAHRKTLDDLSENAADKYGAAMTAIEFIAPGGATLGSGLVRNNLNSKLGKFLVGGLDNSLVTRELGRQGTTRLGLSSIDMSKAANIAGLKMVGRQALEEGLQGGIGEYGSQVASANIGGQAVDWKKVGQSALEEAIVGGLMGGGMQSMSGHTAVNQARQVADNIRSETQTIQQEDLAARQELASAIQLGNTDAIQDAQENLSNVQKAAHDLNQTYAGYGVTAPDFIQSMSKQHVSNQPQQTPTTVPISERERQQQQNAKDLQQQKFEDVYATGDQAPVLDTDKLDLYPTPIIDESKLEPYESPSLSSIVERNTPISGVPQQKQGLSVDEQNPLHDFGMGFDHQIPDHNIDTGSLSSFSDNSPKSITETNSYDKWSGQNTSFKDGETTVDKAPSIRRFPNENQAKTYVKKYGLKDTHKITQEGKGTFAVEPLEQINETLNLEQNTPESDVNQQQPMSYDNEMASQINQAFTDMSQGAQDAALDEVASHIENGREINFTKPESIQQALENPNYNTTPNEDGSVRVLGVKKSDGTWVGIEPTQSTDTVQQDTSPTQSNDLSFADRFRDAHLNNPNAKQQIIADEIATGRPRHEVLKEVGDIVQNINKNKGDDPPLPPIDPPTPTPPKTPPLTPIEQTPTDNHQGKSFSNGTKANEYLKTHNLGDSHEAVKSDMGTYEIQPKTAKTDIEQNISKNGILENTPILEQQEGDIGRASDNAPFLNRQAANLAQKGKKLNESHDIVEVGKNKFVLRPKVQDSNHDVSNTQRVEESNATVPTTPVQDITGIGKASNDTETPVQSTQDFEKQSPLTQLNIETDFGLSLTHHVPTQLFDTPQRLGDIAQIIVEMQTEGVKTDVEYGQKLLKTITALNPDVQLHFVSDLNKISDEKLRGDMEAGGYYRPEQNLLYIYPNSTAWESSILELVNHELVHTITAKPLFEGKVDQNTLDILQAFRDKIDDYRWDSKNTLSENSKDRFTYLTTTNPDHELLSVSIAETEVRSSLKAILGKDGLHQLDDIFKKISKLKSNENEQRKQSEDTGAVKSPSERILPNTDRGSETAVQANPRTSDASTNKQRDNGNRGADLLRNETEQGTKPNTDPTSLKDNNHDVQELDSRSGSPLEGTPAENVRGVQEQGDSDAETRGSSRTDLSGSGQSRTTGDRPERSVADGERKVSDLTRRTDSNNGLDPQQAVVADNVPVDAFVIDENNIAQGGKKTKFKANIAAIRVLRTLEAENRPATKEEQKTLSGFVGWGGLPEAFKREDGSISTNWTKEVAELEALLTPEEMQAAVDSSIAAHYTSPEIVKALWKALENFGFKKGLVLEPAVGVGNFFGLMPKGMRKASKLHAVELDNITGAIAQHLYPEANIKAAMGFQDYQTIDGYFDVAIGNPPFSNIPITDKTRPSISGFSLHNYFFAKSIDSLKPNGVLAMVVTNRFMDKLGDKERSYISDRAELVGAIRLPNDAFLSNAGTQVTTDIIFLRKKADGETKQGETWLDVKNYTDKDGNTVPLNEYFVRHPENMIGDFGAYGSMYRDGEPALIKRDGQDTGKLLNELVEKLPKDIFQAEESQNFEETRQAVIKDISEVKIGAMFVNTDGSIHERLPDVMGEYQSKAVEFTNSKAESRVKGMIATAEQLSKLRTLQLDRDATDSQINTARKKLNTLYDQFHKEHGYLNSDANKRLMRDDPNWPQISSLENNYDRGVSAQVAKSTGQKFRKPSAEKAAIFSKRTQVPAALVEKVGNAKDALIESLNRHGFINTNTMQNLYGKDADEIIKELGDLVYDNPINGYEVRDEYLSGNVKQKLAVAKEYAAKDPKYQRNVLALEKVIPADIEALDIDVKVGSHWIPNNYIADFVNHITGSTAATAEYGKYSNKWEIDKAVVSPAAAATYATDRADVKTILTHALNGTKPTIYDRFSDGTSVVNHDATLEASQRVELVKQSWRDWLWDNDARREHLERLYNDVFNATVNRSYDGSHLTFHGMNTAIELRPHQKNAIWRTIQSKTTLYDHTVGAGKTFTAIASAMEMRRMGIVNKPMLVVPNHLVGQWAKDFILLYPNANILAATKADFEKGNRKKFIAKIANGDYDAIIIAHSSFGKLSISPDQEQTFIDNEIAELMAFEAELKAEKGGRSRNAKDIAKRRLSLEEKKKGLLNSENKDGDNIYWHETGVDAIIVDEAQEFKNLEFTTSMKNVAGLGTGKGSQRAKDLFAKIQLMQQNNEKSKVIFATGTPISNTMAEMFTMQRYLAWNELEQQGISHFDAWAKVFGEVVSDWELSPAGKYKLNNRFAKFVNMPELMQSYLSFADVMNRDDINAQLAKEGKTLGTPKIKGDKPQNIVVERSEEQADYIGVPSIDSNGNEVYPEGSLVWRTENIPRKPEKGADNMLKIMGDARKAALDMRLVDPTAPDFEGSKVNVAVDKTFKTYKQWDAKKGTQLIFCDLSTPKGAVAAEKARIEQLIKKADEGDEAAQEALDKMSPDELSALDSDFSVYDDVKAKLIAKGMKPEQIAFIHDAKTDLQKQELFEKVKRGDIRVLMGSSQKMGAGMNVQNKLVALHHLDAPWRPSDLEQREGRIIRQGNEFYKENPNGFEVEINRYATKQTLDSRMWQTIESKANFIEQVRKGTGSREVEDVAGEAANAAEMKAASSGDPRILQEIDLRKRIKEMEDDKRNFDRGVHRTKGIIRQTETDVNFYQRKVDVLSIDTKIQQPERFIYKHEGKTVHQDDKGARDAIAKIFEKGIGNVLVKGKELVLGDLNGFKIVASPSALLGYVNIEIVGNGDPIQVTNFSLNEGSSVGLVQKLLNQIRSIPEDLAQYQKALKESQDQLPILRSKVENSVWNKIEQLTSLKAEHGALIDELKPKKSNDQQENNQDQNKKFSRNEKQPITGTKINQIEQVLNDRFGNDVVQQLKDNGKLEIVQNIGNETAEGFAENGKVTLIADNIHPENIIPVFLHEVGGHLGFQGMLTENAYKNLMADFNRLVQSGDKIALEAKALADREGNTQAKLDEYLPYLVTRAAQAEASGKLAPVKRLVNRIVSAVKAWVRNKLGIDLKITPNDILALSERMIGDVAQSTKVQKTQRRYSTASNPSNQPHSAQRDLFNRASQSALGQAAISGLEKSKTLSVRTTRLFNTMMHKALSDETGEFKKTFDLIQDKINHVTFASSKSMDVAPSILTQLEKWSDYVQESKRVGQQIVGRKSKLDQDLEKIGKLFFENTLSDQAKVHTDSELRSLGYDQDQINLYREARAAIDTSLDTFSKTTVSKIFQHMGGKSSEILELLGKDLDLNQHVDEVKKKIAAIVQNDPTKQAAADLANEHIDKVLDKLQHLKDTGYTPLMRFGKYVVRVVDPASKKVAYRQHFESESERNLFFNNFDQSKIPVGYQLEKTQVNELEYKLFQGVSPETVALFAKESGLPIGDSETAFIKHAIRDNHALKRLLKRQGIDGFDTDFKRVLASFVLSNSRYSANQTYNGIIDESVTEISNPQYQEDAVRLRDYALDTQEELAGLKNFSFVWYMGFSVMFGVVNMTQPLIQTLPYLLQYSTNKTVVGSAFLKAVQTWRKGTAAIPTAYKSYYELAKRQGHLDPQNTWMLQGQERGKSGLGASTWQLISHASGFFAQASETINRRTTLFAALDVAKELGQTKLEQLGFKDEYDFAVRTIQETQGIYNKGNRPRLARGNVGSMLMMYKQFMIAYIEQMVRMQKRGLYGGADDEFKRRMAKLVGFGISRPLLVMMGLLMSFSGTTGLPFVRDLLDVIETTGGMVGKPFNTEREVQLALNKALGDTIGTAANTALMDGVFNLNPVMDVKGRMGMGDLVPATGYFSPLTSDYQKTNEGNQTFGAMGGLVEKISESMVFAQKGDYGQSAIQLLPKAATSFGQGAIAAATGDYRNMKTGVKTNNASVLDGVVKMLDAQPSRIAKEGRIRGLEMKDTAALGSVNKVWRSRYMDALGSDDQNAVKDLKEEIKEYNADNPRYPITFNQKRAETQYKKDNQSWQEKRKSKKGLEWMDDENPYIE